LEDRDLLYRRQVIKLLYFDKKLSCNNISEKINKSLPLVTKIINDLVKEGIVVENGYAASTGGRRPIMYSLQADKAYILSVAMDQFVTRMVIMDMHNHYETEVKSIELHLLNNAHALSFLAGCIDEFITSSGIDRAKIIGMGIGMPGFVDSQKGTNHTFLHENGVANISQYLTSKTSLPVYIDNDSSLIALAELRFGSARNKKNAMVINAGWGVGLGMILNGELFRGTNGFAGEFSHIPLFNNNKLCTCGKSGCLETETSLLIVIEKVRQALQAGRPSFIKSLPAENFQQAWQMIVEAAIKGDKLSIELLSEAGYNIGRGVAILIHLLNPETIIISGRGSLIGKIWLAPMQQALNEHCIPELGAYTEIQISDLGYHAELIGAATLVMEQHNKKANRKDVVLEADPYSNSGN
jgi:predicted NBD/HSP70 family sugar kinase